MTIRKSKPGLRILRIKGKDLKLKTAAVNACDDEGNRVGGPYFLPLDIEAKAELKTLQREYGAIVFDKPQAIKQG